jgi:hypothetical protein
MPSDVMLHVVKLTVVMLNAILPSVFFRCSYTECYYTNILKSFLCARVRELTRDLIVSFIYFLSL